MPSGKPFSGSDDPRRWRKGRGKGKISLPDIVRRIAEQRVSATDKRTKIEAIIQETYAAALTGDMEAIKFIADRGWGKAVQPVEQSGEMKITTRQLTDEEIAAEIEALERKIKELDGEEAVSGGPCADPPGPA
jgi:ABC-type ATPase with predicted acetyltransferase domain